MKKKKYYIGVRERAWYDRLRGRIIAATIWYPTLEKPEKFKYFSSIASQVKPNAEIISKKHPIAILSHGSGGHRYCQYYITEFLAKFGYVVVALQHPFNNLFDNSQANEYENIRQRHHDILFVIQSLEEDFCFKDYINLEKIGIIGFSFGGFSALILAGAKPELSLIESYFPNAVIAEDDFIIDENQGIQCVLVMAPALGELFKKDSQQMLKIPTCLIYSEHDQILQGSEKIYLKIFSSSLLNFRIPNAGHYVYLMEPSKHIQKISPELWEEVGKKREEVHPLLKALHLSFLNTYLKE